MKTTLNLLRLTLLSALTIARINAQSVGQVTVIKEDQYVQTSASTVVVNPLAPGPFYAGPYSFSTEVSGSSINLLTPAPTITLPLASTFPTDNSTEWNSGTLSYNANNDSWKFGLSGQDVRNASSAARDTQFAIGTYGMNVQSNPISFNFRANTYPANTPSVTLTGGNWVGGKYVIDPSQTLTITSNAFTSFSNAGNADGAISLNVDSLNINSLAFYSTDHSQPNYATVTIPGGTLVAGQEYNGGVGFYALVDKPVVAPLSGALIAAAYGSTTGFTIVAANPATAGARATLYRVGHMTDFNDGVGGGGGYSEVRDVTKVSGVIYAVGNSIAYSGSSFSDTSFLWTSTNGMTPIANIANATTANPPFVTASAITPDAAYIAGRVLAGSPGGSERHATRTTVSGMTNIDLGTLSGYPQHSAATAISSDGSIMYGFARYITPGKTKAVRFTASGPTITAIPFLNIGDDNSAPAPRGTSSDGSVMVGTSSNTSTSGGNLDHAGNQAFRYVEGSGSTGISFLTGGTWNGALAVSADGKLTLVAGNSTAYSGGEVYLHNTLGGTLTSLGAPVGYNNPSNGAGMNADGSLVALSWGSSNNSCFFRNPSGWHSLSAAMTNAGVDLSSWSIDNVFGMSADGTLLWGAGTHNGSTEGWVIEFDPGYLAAYGSIVRDFNADGKSDILWQNNTTGERAMWLMNGGVAQSGASLGVVPTAWQISGVSDFNGDGKADVVLSNTSTGDRAMWLMDGPTVASNLYLGNVPTDWQVGAVGDFDGDGKADIFWRNTVTGDCAMWLMNGGTVTSGAYLGVVPTEWHVSGTGDFNGDGKADLIWTNTTTGERAMWLMNGGTLLGGASLGVVPTDWTISGVGDFNGDGKADVVLSNTSTGDRAMWLMNGTTVASNLYLGNIPVAWTMSAIGDYDGDGKADIFWSNTSTGDRSMWLMNGGTVTSGAYLGSVPTDWINPP